jgi:UDP-N-acetylglucosamine acyltransferase
MRNVHATAIVSNTAEIGENVTIGAYCIIDGNVKIGNGCVLHSHVVVAGNTKIGENCEIFSFASIGSKPQDYKFKNEETFLEIGSGNVIREYVTINPGTANGGGLTKIGDNNFLMISCHIGHDAKVGNNCTIGNNVPLGGHVVLEDFVTIGGNSAIHQQVMIGTQVMIGGMVGVKENIIPYALVMPREGSIYGAIRGVNIVGLKKRGFEKSDIVSIVKYFEKLAGCSSVLEYVDGETEKNEYIQKIVDFIRQSQNFEHSKGLAPFCYAAV